MINNRFDIMVDIETLGNETDSTIFQISAGVFNIETGEIVDTFDMIADIEKNKKPINVTGGTIKWWLETNKELFTELLNKGEESSESIIQMFASWIISIQNCYGKENVYLWGNGILFDNKIIQYQMEQNGLKYPIYYRNDRDVRTIVELASMKSGLSEKELKSLFNDKSLVAHNAIDDVKYQIKLVSGCYEMIMGKRVAVFDDFMN